jgi:hypothetical protein
MMIGSNAAIGTKNIFYGQKQEHILNFVWQIPDSGFRLRASGGYLWGGENYDFPSGRSRAYLHQYSALLSARYVFPEDRSPIGLQSVGLSAWGSRAKQDGASGAPRSFIEDTTTEWRVIDDPLKLAEGSLTGVAWDAQVALLPEVVGKLSTGYERLTYPFSDGTRERNEHLFWSGGLNWQPFSKVTVGADYLSGVGERRTSVKVESGSVALNGFYSQGQNGVADNSGVMMIFQLIGPKKSVPSTDRRGDDIGSGGARSGIKAANPGGTEVASEATFRADEDETLESAFGFSDVPVPESLKHLDHKTRHDTVRYIRALLAAGGVRGKKPVPEIDRSSLAWLMKPSRSADPSSLLDEASSRPEQFPQGFLAKPDPTAVRVINVIKKAGLPAGATINSEGDITIPISGGTPSITDFLRNGAAYANTGKVTTGNSVIVLHSRNFPSASAGGDTWIVRGLDGGGLAYQLVIETE